MEFLPFMEIDAPQIKSLDAWPNNCAELDAETQDLP